MPPRIHTAHVYRAFDLLVRKTETRLGASTPAISGYPSDAVTRRIAQCIVAHAIRPVLLATKQRIDGNSPRMPWEDAEMCADGITIGTADGSLKVGARLRLRGLVRFLYKWLRVLSACGVAWLRPARDRTGVSCTLVYGIGAENLFAQETDGRFVDFCRRGLVAPLARGRLIVQSGAAAASIDSMHFTYGPDPVLTLAQAGGFTSRQFFEFLSDHVAGLAAFVTRLITFPPSCLLAEDIAYHAIARHLNQRRLIENVVITLSNLAHQPLWMAAMPGRRYRLHMVWYAMNVAPYVYAADRTQAQTPSLRHITVDESWVWTHGQENYLRSAGTGGIFHVVGPVLWYLPEPARPNTGRTTNIALFDVTPLTPEAERRLVGRIYNYNRTQTMVAFVEGVIAAAGEAENNSGKKIRLLLKHKRGYHDEYHDRRYIDLITRLEREGRLTVIPPQTNMFTLLAQAMAAIVVPFSSPAYVATHVGTPAIYFDATQELLPTHEPDPLLRFCSGTHELTAAISQLLSPQE